MTDPAPAPSVRFPERLAEGHLAFQRDRYAAERQRYARLAAKGQSPAVLVVACVDSRVSPEVVFDADPGEMLVVRNVANLVPPYQPDSGYHGTSAAIEFAVRRMEVRHLVVMGHESCGGIAAFRHNLRSGVEPGDFVGRWMRIMEPAAGLVLTCEGCDPLEDQRGMEQAAVRQSLRNLRGFPWLAEREAAGLLSLHGAWFGIARGTLSVLDEANGTFAPLAPPPAAAPDDAPPPPLPAAVR